MPEIKNVRQDFPMIINHPELIYFDSGATSFKPYSVIEAVNNYYCYDTCNIHRGDYDLSFKVSTAYDEVRNKIKSFINAKRSEEIIFTSGATESLNLVASGLSHLLNEKDYILTSHLEHASSVLPWFNVAKKTGAQIIYIPVNKEGETDLEAIEELFKTYPIKIVALIVVSNVLGNRMPIEEITRIAHQYGAIVSADGAQSLPHEKTDVQAMDVDLLSFSGHKMIGPSGVGVLYGKMAVLELLEAPYFGGGANARFNACGDVILKDIPERFETGTPAIEAVLGLGVAVDYLSQLGMDKVEEREAELKAYLLAKISELDNVELINHHPHTAVISFNVKGVFAQDAATYLNSQGICVRSGNHCAKILQEITGVNESLRASLYFYNTEEEIDRFISVLKTVTIENCIGVFF